MDIVSLCDTVSNKDDKQFKLKCLEVANEITNGNTTILSVIEQMGTLLTNPSYSQRELGVSALTVILENLPDDYLTVQQLNVIVTFYSEKLKDHHQILPVVFKGIFRLLHFKHFPEEQIAVILNTMIQNIACQQQQQEDRYTIYCIFQHIFDQYPEALHSMDIDFVYVVITSIDGERDPRNLIFLFSWLKRFLPHAPLKHLSEEMFDIIACYFPVDFKVPPSESQITREMLADSLCPCLCSREEFGELAVSLALEKLDSSLEIAKVDSLKLLKEGCHNFSSSAYIENALKIWTQLQKEIFSTSSTEIRVLCLETLTAVIAKISEDKQQTEILKSIIQSICDTVRGNLLPDSKVFQSSADILFHVAKGSELSSEYIVREVIPFLTNTINITTTSSHKAELLRYLLDFTKTYLQYHKKLNDILKDVPSIFIKATLEGDQMLQEKNYEYLGEISNHLAEDLRPILYNNICTLIVNCHDIVLRCLKPLASLYPDEVKAHILDKIKLNSAGVVASYLKAVVCLVSLSDFTELIITKVFELLANSEYEEVVIECIVTYLEQEEVEQQVFSKFMEADIVGKLVTLGLKLSQSCGHEETLLRLSKILKILIGTQDSKAQRKILECHLESICSHLDQHETSVVLLDGILLRINRDVHVNYDILDKLFGIALQTNSIDVRNVAVKLLANLLIKKEDDELFHSCVDRFRKTTLNYLTTHKEASVLLLVWIVKVLLMKNYPDCLSWVDLLIDLLDQHEEVVENLRIIMDDSYECLSIASHCRYTLLYRQKFFIYITNKMSDDLKNEVYLKALGYLIERAPEQVVLLHFKKIKSMIMMSLEKCYHPDVLVVLLQTIKKTMKEESSAVESNLEDFLSRILKLTSFEKSMNVRIEAVQCLFVIATSFPLYKLLPFKNTVVLHLGKCIDDKKRLVRKEAMNARSLWYILDAP